MPLRSLLVRFLRWWRRQSGPWPSVGRQSYVDHSAQFLGAAEVRIGDKTAIGEGCWFNVNHRGAGQLGIIVGNSCFIGRRNFFNSGSLIELSDFVMTGPDCHFLGANHSFDDPLKPYVLSEIGEEKPMRIGANCWLGSGAIILRGITVGHGSVIGAGSVVTHDVKPFSVVVGNPAKTLRRFNFQTKSWVTAEEWQAAWEKDLPDETTYIALLKEKYPRVHVPAIASSSVLGNI